jgi:malic enzyme
VTKAELDLGCAYPPLQTIREVSTKIAVAVAEQMFLTNRATKPRPCEHLIDCVRDQMYVPSYDFEIASGQGCP